MVKEDWLSRANNLDQKKQEEKLRKLGLSNKQISDLKEKLNVIAMKIVDEYIKEQTQI